MHYTEERREAVKPRKHVPIAPAHKARSRAGARKPGCNVLTAGGLKRVLCGEA
jgi:hypothetical protein